jgi:hypothetical protein
MIGFDELFSSEAKERHLLEVVGSEMQVEALHIRFVQSGEERRVILEENINTK